MSRETRSLSEVCTLGEIFEPQGGREIAKRVLARSGGGLDFMRELARDQAMHSSFDRVLGLDIPPEEMRGYSITRAIDALAARDLSRAGLEREVSRHVERVTGRSSEGLFIPFGVLGRDFNVGTANQAGNLTGAPVEQGRLVDPLRANMALTRLGALMLGGFRGDFTVPRFSSSAAVGAVSEVGASTPSDPTTGVATFAAKRLGGYITPSRAAIIQGGAALDRVLMQQLLKIALAQLESGAINGDGDGNNPLGVRATSGVGSVLGGENGAQLTWNHVLDLENTPALVDAEPGEFAGYLTNTKVRRSAKATARATYQPMIWTEGEKPLNGYRALCTSNVPSNLTKGTAEGVCSSLLFSSDWSMLLIAIFGAPDVFVDPVTLADQGKLRVVANVYAASGVLMPAAFAKMDDVLTSGS